jgi:cytochrome c553
MTKPQRPGHKPLSLSVLGLACGTLLAPAVGMAAALPQPQQELIESYCSGCHNLDDYAGGLAFDLLSTDSIVEEAGIWEKVIRKLKAGMMPPPDQPRPTPLQVTALVATLEHSIDSAAAERPSPQAPLLRRLNRSEYQNAIRDLLDLPVNASELMPADDSSDGFDNVANVLSISPVLLEAYLSAASKISRLALGDMDTAAASTTYRSDGQSQARQKDGLTLGTRGGVVAEHVFQLDAEYEITVGRSGLNSAFALTPFGQQDPVELAIDGQRVALLQPDDSATLRLAVPAGRHRVEAAYLPLTPGLGVDDLHTEWAASTGIGTLQIRGPLNASGPGDTASRRRIFSCLPQNADAQPGCAEQILRQLATRAYRRPVAQADLDILLGFYREGQSRGGFEAGIQYALARLLVDPNFIFRFEQEPEALAAGALYAVDGYELASRLSFFLWSSIPDEQLLQQAAEGRLADPAVLAAEVQRMLADPKADALVSNFATQWLQLRRLEAANPLSRDFDNALRASMFKETQLLFRQILREDASIIDLLAADYSFVDERLARHYGLPGIRGSHFRKVQLPDAHRRGLLGHASILTITSAPNRTSPVMRGTWILENLLGTPTPAPPPGVETNLEVSVTGSAARSIRAQLEQHRANPSCAACHDVIDPLGFALENFDAVGKWRLQDSGVPVDTRAQLWDGSALQGAASLHEALLARQDLFVETFIGKMMTYALGRTVADGDMPAIRAIARQAAAADFRFSAVVQGIVDSAAFRMRSKSRQQGEAVQEALATASHGN